MSETTPFIRTEAFAGSITVYTQGSLIAESTSAIALFEGSYPTTYYIPKADIQMSLLLKSDHETLCPHKGIASYWSLNLFGQIVENAAWSYEDPISLAEAIRGYVSFYPEKIDAIQISHGRAPSN